jgi:hypothetical protein
MFFVMANFGVFTAWVRYAKGERIASWSPSQRVTALPQLAPTAPAVSADRIETQVPLQEQTL